MEVLHLTLIFCAAVRTACIKAANKEMMIQR